MRSASLNTNSRSWLTQITALPASRSSPIISATCADSWTPERRRRLVEQDDRLVHPDRPGDGDHLALTARQQTDRCADVAHADLELAQHGAGLALHPAAVEDHAELPRQVAERHVVGDVEALHQREVLVDDGDAVVDRVGHRAPLRQHLAEDQHLTFVGAMDAGDDLDGRRLAGPVVPDDRVHLTGVRIEGDVLQGGDGAEVLLDAAQPQRGSVAHQL